MSQSQCVPVGDLRVCNACCCTITGIGCKFPECVGCGVDGLICCFKNSTVMCKPMNPSENDDKKCCICTQGGCFCVKPTTCCAFQEQCCCADTRCALPCTENVPMMLTCLPCCVVYPGFGCFPKVKDVVKKDIGDMDAGEKFSGEMSDVDIKDVRVVTGCCCSICGLYTKFPACCGIKTETICLCCQAEEACCKPIMEENPDKICFICCDGGNYLVMPSTCISTINTCCCIDSRCAFPCTDKVPCVCTCLPGCVVAANKKVKVACCPLAGALMEQE